MSSAAPEPLTWIPKAKAAEILGLSLREIERKAKAGRLRSRRVSFTGERSRRAVYAEADVFALKAARDANAVSASPTALAPLPILEAQTGLARAQAHVFDGLAVHLAKLSALYPPPEIRKGWLTLEEAVEHSGLPRAELVRLLGIGTLYSFGRGPKTWRIQRASLDAYGRVEHQ